MEHTMKPTPTLLAALLLAPLAAVHAGRRLTRSSKLWNTLQRLFSIAGNLRRDGFQ